MDDHSVKPTGIPSIYSLLRSLRNSKSSDYVIILDSDMATFNVHQHPCELYMISEGAVLRHYAMAMRKGSPLVNQINSDILRMQESGELNFLANKWFPSRCTETVYANDEETFEIPKFYSVTIGTFSSAFLILVAGIILGGLATVLEVCIYKWAENIFFFYLMDYYLMNTQEFTFDYNKKDAEREDGMPINKEADADLDSSDMMISPDPKPGSATQV